MSSAPLAILRSPLREGLSLRSRGNPRHDRDANRASAREGWSWSRDPDGTAPSRRHGERLWLPADRDQAAPEDLIRIGMIHADSTHSSPRGN